MSLIPLKALTALGSGLGLQSCNVVRTISNKSEYYQRGDTSVVMFLAQKDSPLGKKTFKAYLWQVCLDAYDAEHPQG